MNARIVAVALAAFGLSQCGRTPTGTGEDGGSPTLAVQKSAVELDVAVRLVGRVKLLENGSVRLKIRAGCPVGFEVLEAFVTVSQPQTFSETFFHPSCDGHVRLFRVVATPLEESFQPGSASVSAIVIAEDPETGDILSGSDGKTVELKRGPHEKD